MEEGGDANEADQRLADHRVGRRPDSSRRHGHRGRIARPGPTVSVHDLPCLLFEFHSYKCRRVLMDVYVCVWEYEWVCACVDGECVCGCVHACSWDAKVAH